MVMLWRQSLLCISYNLCILNNLHWKLSRRTNVLHPSIWNTWSLLCQMQSVICFHRNVRLLIYWNENVDSVNGKTLILVSVNCIGGLNVLHIEHLRAGNPGGCKCCSSLSIAGKWRVLNRTFAWAYACCIPWYMLTSFWLSGSSSGI